MKCKERMDYAWTALFNGCISTDNEEQVNNLRSPKRISKANQTPKKTAHPEDEAKGI